MLPPALALRKEAEDVPRAVSAARTEAEVRHILTEVNEKIERAIRMPPRARRCGWSPSMWTGPSAAGARNAARPEAATAVPHTRRMGSVRKGEDAPHGVPM